MKSTATYVLATFLAVSLMACKKDKLREIPFTLTFFSIGGPIPGDTRCGPPEEGVFAIRQDGEGTGTLLGKFTFEAEFCNDLNTGAYGVPEELQDQFPLGTFIAANGDEIYFIGGGQLVPSTDPNYDLMFQDPFEIVGGTGRFAGATGEGMTDSYVDLEAGRTDHVWTGVIRLMN